MKASDLSKQKYIYKVYMNSIGEIHCEKLRIIYANKAVVYVKSPGDNYLDMICTPSIRDSINEIKSMVIKVYVWNVDMDKLHDLQLTTRKNNIMCEMRILESNMTSYKLNFENAAKNYDRLSKELKKLTLEAENEESKLL